MNAKRRAGVALKGIVFAIALLAGTFPAQAGDGVAATYPILAIQRAASSDALLEHELTAAERRLFREIDAATARLPSGATLVDHHRVAVEIGARYGLDARESIAFFTRTTFSEFEP